MEDGPLAQLAELRAFNPQVPGSSPGGSTNICLPNPIGRDSGLRSHTVRVRISGQAPF